RSEIEGGMGGGGIGGLDGSLSGHDRIKQLGSARLGFLSQIVPQKHGSGALDQILNDPFPAIIGERDPIDLRLSVPLEKWRASYSAVRRRLADKDEIALFGSQHHIIPIDDKHPSGSITYQIGRMQVRMADNVWP